MRNRKLLDLAHSINECQMQIPSVCTGYEVNGCEPAHGPKSLLGGGMARKADDVFAASCHACHAELDQGKSLTREERVDFWLRGAAKTWALLMDRGMLRVL